MQLRISQTLSSWVWISLVLSTALALPVRAQSTSFSITRNPFGIGSLTYRFELIGLGGIADDAGWVSPFSDCGDAPLLVTDMNLGPNFLGITATDTTTGLCFANHGGSFDVDSTAPFPLEFAVCLGSSPCSQPADLIPPGGSKVVGALTFTRSPAPPPGPLVPLVPLSPLVSPLLALALATTGLRALGRRSAVSTN